MAQSTADGQTEIQIKLPQPPSRISTELTAKDLLKERRIAFLRPISSGGENSWVISLFVILHLVAFTATMIVNDCWQNSHRDCALKALGRFSFQPLSENPLLGPSASALDEMGALRQTFLEKHHHIWRLFASAWLHAGIVHFLINLSCVIFVGIHMEQDFGSLRIGAIYILSAFTGGLVAALFLQDRPSVTSSGALFGLLGTMLSSLIQNWQYYNKKFAAIVAFSIIFILNLVLGLLPYINNFSNIGGFISGLLLGFVLLFAPQLGKTAQTKAGLFDYDFKCSANLRQKLDRPVLRIVALSVFGLLLAGLLVAVLHGINMNKYCSWCQYIDCVPSKWWSCNHKSMHCQTMISMEHLTLTCTANGKFRIFPFTNISESRIEDLCSIICS